VRRAEGSADAKAQSTISWRAWALPALVAAAQVLVYCRRSDGNSRVERARCWILVGFKPGVARPGAAAGLESGEQALARRPGVETDLQQSPSYAVRPPGHPSIDGRNCLAQKDSIARAAALRLASTGSCQRNRPVKAQAAAMIFNHRDRLHDSE
jgi:hypothetical protein